MTRLPALGGLAAILGVILAWELLPEAEVPAGAAPPTAAAAGIHDDADIDMGHLKEIAATLLQRPLFSPNRRLAPAVSGATLGASEDLPRLSGVVIGPAGARAILEDGTGRQMSAATGDSIGRFKVGTISPGQVSLFAPEGERVLRPKFTNVAGAAGTSASQAAGPAK
jgi:hypothetical protein